MGETGGVDLEIRILAPAGDDGMYPVTARGLDDRRAQARFRSPFTPEQVRDAVAALDAGRLTSPRALLFGEALFESLVQGELRTVYDTSMSRPHGAVIQLIVDDGSIAALPWELMADPRVHAPLAARHRLVRGFSTCASARPLVVESPLRVLIAESAPVGTVPLASSVEIDEIRKAIGRLAPRRRIEVEVLRHAGESSLVDALRHGPGRRPRPIHVLHWIGHGRLAPGGGRLPELLFEKDDRACDPVDGERLATILAGSDVRLVFLNACHSAAEAPANGEAPSGGEGPPVPSTPEVAGTLAEALLKSGIPAVVGMRGAVGDERARRFARDFYAALADGRTVDEALFDARRLVRQGAEGSAADIGIPICYLRGLPARLLEPSGAARGVRARLGLSGRAAGWLIGTVGAALVGTAAVTAALALWGSFQPPPRMNGEFNVVVTEFTRSDGTGRPVPDQTARDLSHNLYSALDENLRQLEPQLQVEVMSPDESGRIDAPTAEGRNGQAARLAAATNADMVIFGSLDPKGTSLQPAFYVVPDVLPGAEEIVGASWLGGPIRSFVPPGSPAVAVDLRQQLQARTRSLTAFVSGLTALTTGDYPRAEAEFKEAAAEPGWADVDGKEIVYLYEGSAAALQGPSRLQDARNLYLYALKLNPGYGRAMIGVATVDLHLSSGRCSPETIAAAGVRKARDEYTAALVAPDQPFPSNVAAKAHFGIGRADVCLSEALVESRWEEARAEFGKVIAAYEGGNATLRELASESHGELAIVLMPGTGSQDAENHYRAAADEYRAAIELAQDPRRRAVFWDELGWTLEQVGDRQAAASAYDQAISLAPDAASEAAYRRHRQQLDASATPLEVPHPS